MKATVTIEYTKVDYSTKNNTIISNEPVYYVTFSNGYKTTLGAFINDVCNTGKVSIADYKKTIKKMGLAAAEKFVDTYYELYLTQNPYAK